MIKLKRKALKSHIDILCYNFDDITKTRGYFLFCKKYGNSDSVYNEKFNLLVNNSR